MDMFLTGAITAFICTFMGVVVGASISSKKESADE